MCSLWTREVLLLQGLRHIIGTFTAPSVPVMSVTVFILIPVLLRDVCHVPHICWTEIVPKLSVRRRTTRRG